MHAQFHSTGRLEIFNVQGEILIAGVPGTKPGSNGYHPMLEYAISMMKLKGDWPDNPLHPQRVTLEDASTIQAGV